MVVNKTFSIDQKQLSLEFFWFSYKDSLFSGICGNFFFKLFQSLMHWYLTESLPYLFVLAKVTSIRFLDCRCGLVIEFVFGVEGRKKGTKCIILFNLKHEKTVLNFEDVSKFQHFMIFMGMFYRMAKFIKTNLSESTILGFLHYLFDFLIFLTP